VIVRHTYINVFSSGFGALVGFVVSILLVRVYGVEVIGRIAFMTGLVGLLRFVVDLGIDQAGLKYISEKEVDFSRELSAYAAIKAVLLAVFLALSAVFLVFVFRPDDPLLYVVVAVNLFWETLADVFQNVLTARREFGPLAIRRNTARLGMLACAVLFCTGVKGFYLVAVLPTIEFALLTVLLIHYVRRGMKAGWANPGRDITMRFCRYALPISLSTGLSLSTSNLDKVFVGHLLSSVHVGYLAVAERIYGGFLVIVKAVTQQLLPEVTFRLANLEKEQFKRQMERITCMGNVLATFLALVVLIYADDLIRVAYGPGLETAAFILRVFSIEILVKLFFRPYHSLIYATERHALFLWLTLPTQAVRLALMYFLVPVQWAGVTIGGAAKPLAISAVWLAPRGVAVLWSVRRAFGTLFLSGSGRVFGVFLVPVALAVVADRMISSIFWGSVAGMGILALHLVLLRLAGVLDPETVQALVQPIRDGFRAVTGWAAKR
jgi:O-antigen/teichoic acid export membrane protein